SFDIQEMQVNLTRLQDLHANRPDPEASRPVEAGDSEPLEGHVELRNVSFGYHPLDPPLIEDFSLTIAPGQRVALVGATGSGKSTIARLVAGLLRPWQGEILFDGKPRQKIAREALARGLAYVEQDYAFFMGSVEDNLTLWDPAVPPDRLRQSCDAALIGDV